MEECFLLYPSQCAGEVELLQLRAVCKGRPQDFNNVRAGQVNYLEPLTALTGSGPNPREIWRKGERNDASFGLVGSRSVLSKLR